MPTSQVVITGIGVVSALGLRRHAFWESLLQGRSGIIPLAQRTDGDVALPAGTRPAGTTIGGAVTDFDPKQWVRPRKALKVMCREIQTAFAASQMAIDDAGLAERLPASPDGPLLPERIGTVFGSEMFYGRPDEMLDALRDCIGPDNRVDPSRFGNAAIRQVMPLWMLKYLPNMPACHVGIAINAQGPNNTLVLGDVSGPSAIIEATSCLRRGLADLIVAGAVGTRINATRINYRGDVPLTVTEHPPAEACRPHFPAATGTVGGEGAATMILETADAARHRGATPLAEVVSAASRFHASAAIRRRSQRLAGPASPSSRGRGQPDEQASTPTRQPTDTGRGAWRAVAAAIEAVLDDSGIDASRVGLIVGHAMGDPETDAAERRGLADRFPNTPVFTPIPGIGHCGAASGMFGIAAAAAAIVAGVIPPTVNARFAPAEANLISEPTPLSGDHVLCLTQTSEGACTAVLLRTCD